MTGRPLLLMIPGAYFRPGDFEANGIMEALAGHDVDVTEVPPCPERYLDGDAGIWLHETYVAPAAGRTIWMLGISLGAMGALMHAAAFPGVVAGIVVLAPFLGTRGLIAEAVAAGGLSHWSPGLIPQGDIERRLLAGLGWGLPRNLHLGCGTKDRYRDASRLLAENMPADRVVWRDGGHDWVCWRRLWAELLRTVKFDEASPICEP
jgi:pimeloyl-ACP methyl ester carboxylesterase